MAWHGRGPGQPPPGAHGRAPYRRSSGRMRPRPPPAPPRRPRRQQQLHLGQKFYQRLLVVPDVDQVGAYGGEEGLLTLALWATHLLKARWTFCDLVDNSTSLQGPELFHP